MGTERRTKNISNVQYTFIEYKKCDRTMSIATTMLWEVLKLPRLNHE